jgi:glyoxylate reductase
MNKPKVFVTRQIPEQGAQLIREFCQAEFWPEALPPDYETLLQKVSGLDGLVCLLTDPIDAVLMDAAGPGLKVISNHAVGYDNIDVAAATQRGIPVGNTPGILTETTADFAFALLMAAARRLVEADQFTRAGSWKTWDPMGMLGVDIYQSTLGIVGYGRIGQAVAKRAAGFEMRILYSDPSCPQGDEPDENGALCVDLDTLLENSDFISIHTPLNEATHHLFDANLIAKMKTSAILINTARGPIVDPEALYQALFEGKIAYAALDVTEPEPIQEDSPLLKLKNILITPHIASASRTTRGKMALIAARNLIAGLKGERLPYCVNSEVYDQKLS